MQPAFSPPAPQIFLRHRSPFEVLAIRYSVTTVSISLWVTAGISGSQVRICLSISIRVYSRRLALSGELLRDAFLSLFKAPKDALVK